MPVRERQDSQCYEYYFLGKLTHAHSPVKLGRQKGRYFYTFADAEKNLDDQAERREDQKTLYRIVCTKTQWDNAFSVDRFGQHSLNLEKLVREGASIEYSRYSYNKNPTPFTLIQYNYKTRLLCLLNFHQSLSYDEQYYIESLVKYLESVKFFDLTAKEQLDMLDDHWLYAGKFYLLMDSNWAMTIRFIERLDACNRETGFYSRLAENPFYAEIVVLEQKRRELIGPERRKNMLKMEQQKEVREILAGSRSAPATPQAPARIPTPVMTPAPIVSMPSAMTPAPAMTGYGAPMQYASNPQQLHRPLTQEEQLKKLLGLTLNEPSNFVKLMLPIFARVGFFNLDTNSQLETFLALAQSGDFQKVMNYNWSSACILIDKFIKLHPIDRNRILETPFFSQLQKLNQLRREYIPDAKQRQSTAIQIQMDLVLEVENGQISRDPVSIAQRLAEMIRQAEESQFISRYN